MIRISDKQMCTGCTACMAVCPAQCIVMRRDRQGFDYPVANPDRCIGCGKCEKVCPVLNPMEAAEPLASYAVRVPEYVSGSSSGGVFPALAKNVTANGGVVFGAVLNPDMTVGHTEAEDLAGVEAMRGSKYVQSDMYDSYGEVKHYLEDDRDVMFTGTPCQVAGLKSFLGRSYDNLLTVEMVCHGAPSPGLWEKYVQSLGDKYGARITDVKFRDKTNGWRHYAFTVTSGNGRRSVQYKEDPYMMLFLQDMTLRPSCYSCPAKGGRSRADITLADLWNVAAVASHMDDDKGVSLVLANSDKGEAALAAACDLLVPVDFALASQKNAGFHGDVKVPERRDEFFAGMHSAKDIRAYMAGFVVRKNIFLDCYQRLHTFLSKIKRRILK